MTLLKDQAIHATLVGDWKNAALLNKALVNDNPKDIDALNRLAYALTVLGKIRDAKIIYKKVLKIDILNQIAMRNMKKFTEVGPRQLAKSLSFIKTVSNTFLEETGKTKVISLINTAQPKVIGLLSTGQPVIIAIKRSKIFVQDQNKQYLGVLPDDLGRRLVKLMRGGNSYEAYVKSANIHNVCIFIKEIKRASRYKNQPSFPQTQEQNLTLKNKARLKTNHEFSEEDRPSTEET